MAKLRVVDAEVQTGVTRALKIHRVFEQLCEELVADLMEESSLAREAAEAHCLKLAIAAMSHVEVDWETPRAPVPESHGP